jgi:hypothetical protein
MRIRLGELRSLIDETSKKVIDLSTKRPKGVGYDAIRKRWPDWQKTWAQQVDGDGPWNGFELAGDLIAFTLNQDKAFKLHAGKWAKFDVKKAHELYAVATRPVKDPTYGLSYYDVTDKDKVIITFKQLEQSHPDALRAAVENESMVRVGEEKMSADDAVARRIVQKTWKFWAYDGSLYVDFPEGDTIGVWNPKTKSWDI